MAPEIVLRKPYNGYKADVWAVGVLIYVCLSGKFPFNGKLKLFNNERKNRRRNL